MTYEATTSIPYYSEWSAIVLVLEHLFIICYM
jgi:hypothetical protein